MPAHSISRRGLLLGGAFAAACGRKKATGFPGLAFVANREGQSVTAIDLNRFRPAGQIRLDAAPASVVAHPKHARVFALAPDISSVFEIDGRELKVVRRVRHGSSALALRLSPAADALWLACREPAQLVELTLDSMEPRRRIPLPFPPDDWDIVDTGRAAVAASAARAVAVVSLEHSKVERTVRVPSEPAIVRFQGDGRQFLVGSRPDRGISIFDTASGRTVTRLPVPVEPRYFCFNRDGGQLFVTGDGMDAVVIVYPYDTQVAETILAGRAPGTMAVTPSYLLVANPETSGLTVLDIETRKLVAVVNVGQAPRHILITPDEQYALVLNHGSSDLAVVRIASLAARRYKSAPLFTMIPVGRGPVGAAVVRVA